MMMGSRLLSLLFVVVMMAGGVAGEVLHKLRDYFRANCQKTFKHRLLFSFDLIGGYLNKLGHFVPQ